ncbi:C-type mannose receptor 2-like isoform X2 [Melanotaenia boesemani]|uniref:C-type mannose receptor 2-like isoform X2 n=1 Tax=Melanotaenia boesemani TaxID=1250792 RepID=UPI001C053B22|nr:C-type mannose receptor 2-like isoform X2 [Melanotaenia boesemani]
MIRPQTKQVNGNKQQLEPFPVQDEDFAVVYSHILRKYHYVNIPKTWAEAQAYCRDVYADLATIDSQAGNNRLLGGIQDPGKQAWIGLFDDAVWWKWTLGDVYFNINENFSNWKPGEPNNEDSNQSCVVMQFDGLWRDENCDTDRPSVCFNEQGPPKYYLMKTFMTWGNSLDYCRSNYTDLARVLTMSEVNEIYPPLGRNHWIGLHRNLWSNWSDQSPVTFTNWNNSKPDNQDKTMTSCAALNTTTGTWYDHDCDKKHEFICQTLIPPRSRIKMKFQSEADLSDPDIQQQILEQLHAKLKTNGITDFTLRWIDADGQTFRKEQSKKKG